MKLDFTKYQGTGNDFVMIDNLSGSISLTTQGIEQLCDRRFGVGADGVILLEPSDTADFTMNYYNSDGTQSFCGNGSRCAVAFFRALGNEQVNYSFEAIDGMHEAIWRSDGVELKMSNVEFPTDWNGHFFLDTGSPHVVRFVENVSEIDVPSEGRQIRNHQDWGERGTNVNFVSIDGNELFVRTYERGVEDETLSCGTGVTAVALVTAFSRGVQPTAIHTLGGELRVNFERSDAGFTAIWLKGPAKEVFSGTVNNIK